ncbi:hypothetical protein PLESTB_001725400 [Pleodorina starrii]|uniref:DAGKc domain-containing protein n=1 Tax=Pleodorina starrii TaxID=330485 RepID=A0A9W6BZ03_9CHLO|nr:hypothetical protein PLESTB_001725400 [Pleodorina starrii]GLC69948.1 hypothetical protein PLESTF_000902600 [Pleodorina starrii]
MASPVAVAPPATDPGYRAPLEPAGPLLRSASASAAPPDVSYAAAGPGGAAAATGRRVSVILHGKRADETDVRAAVAALRSEGVRVDVKVTWESGDVERFVKDIVKSHSADTIVAAGGDGTLNEVVAALIKVRAPSNIAVGLMPMGTSNDFAAVTGIPQDLGEALRLCCRSDNLRPLDVGLLNGEVFMNTATLGASSELGSETSHDAKKLLGPAAYLVKGVARLAGYTAVPVKMRFPAPDEAPAAAASPLPGATTAAAAAEKDVTAQAGAAPTSEQQQQQQMRPQAPQMLPSSSKGKAASRSSKSKGGRKTVEIREEVLNLTAGNSRQLASMVQACPDALLDDGLLDITYVTGGAVEGATRLVGEILSRGLDDAQPANVHILRVPWIEVAVEDQDPDLTWPGNRDGEPVPPSRRFLLEALPRRIKMHLPDASRALLTEGADPRVNAPVIAINRMRKGAFKAMLAQVRRFRRIIPGSRPWWRAALSGLMVRAPLLLLGFAIGYGSAARSGVTPRTGSPERRRQQDKVTEGEEEREKEKEGVVRNRWRGAKAVLPFWPTGRRAQREVGAGVVG